MTFREKAAQSQPVATIYLRFPRPGKAWGVFLSLLLLLFCYLLFFSSSQFAALGSSYSPPSHSGNWQQLEQNLKETSLAVAKLAQIQREINQRYLQREELHRWEELFPGEKGWRVQAKNQRNQRGRKEQRDQRGQREQQGRREGAAGRYLSSLYSQMKQARYLLELHRQYGWAYYGLIRNIPHRWPLERSNRFRGISAGSASGGRSLQITSLYGPRRSPVDGVRRLHRGIDLKGNSNTPVVATAAGIVIEARYSQRGYGNRVRLLHLSGYETLFAHLSSIEVANYEMVYPGRQLGRVGSSGSATGPHLHYEIRKDGQSIDPLRYMDP